MNNQWIRLSREQTQSVLEKLSTHKDAIVFSRDTTEVAVRELPFYNAHRIFRVTNYATMPSFSMQYLSDSENFISLDGTANPVYTVNEKEPLRLTEITVVPYLDFFFSYVQGSEGDIFLIKDPRKMPFMGSLSPDQQQTVVNSFKPLLVTHDENNPHHFKVSGTLYYDGSLLSASIRVNPEGKLAFENQSLLLQGIHFPHDSLYQNWMTAE